MKLLEFCSCSALRAALCVIAECARVAMDASTVAAAAPTRHARANLSAKRNQAKQNPGDHRMRAQPLRPQHTQGTLRCAQSTRGHNIRRVRYDARRALEHTTYTGYATMRAQPLSTQHAQGTLRCAHSPSDHNIDRVTQDAHTAPQVTTCAGCFAMRTQPLRPYHRQGTL